MSEQFGPKGGYRYREGPTTPSPWDQEGKPPLTEKEKKKAEKLHQQVMEGLHNSFVRTPDKIKAARETVLSHMDEVETERLKAVKETGHEIGKTKLIVNYSFDKELGVWEFKSLKLQEELKFNDEVKFVQLEENTKYFKKSSDPHPSDCGCFDCDLKRGKEK